MGSFILGFIFGGFMGIVLIALVKAGDNEDYKSRNEKAREMIKFIAYNSERPLTITELNKVYNILGDDNER